MVDTVFYGQTCIWVSGGGGGTSAIDFHEFGEYSGGGGPIDWVPIPGFNHWAATRLLNLPPNFSCSDTSAEMYAGYLFHAEWELAKKKSMLRAFYARYPRGSMYYVTWPDGTRGQYEVKDVMGSYPVLTIQQCL